MPSPARSESGNGALTPSRAPSMSLDDMLIYQNVHARAPGSLAFGTLRFCAAMALDEKATCCCVCG